MAGSLFEIITANLLDTHLKHSYYTGLFITTTKVNAVVIFRLQSLTICKQILLLFVLFIGAKSHNTRNV